MPRKRLFLRLLALRRIKGRKMMGGERKGKKSNVGVGARLTEPQAK